MRYQTRAVYRGGVFVPELPSDLPEGAEVDLLVLGPFVVPPPVMESDQRADVLRRITQRMKQNPIPTEAPRFTRDALHDGR